MLYPLLGVAILAATAFVFWSARPVNGKVRDWITPAMEPYLTIGILMGGVVGLFLLGVGVASIRS
jgi:hypothetical protein